MSWFLFAIIIALFALGVIGSNLLKDAIYLSSQAISLIENDSKSKKELMEELNRIKETKAKYFI